MTILYKDKVAAYIKEYSQYDTDYERLYMSANEKQVGGDYKIVRSKEIKIEKDIVFNFVTDSSCLS